MLKQVTDRQQLFLGKYEKLIKDKMGSARLKNLAERLLKKDPALWVSDRTRFAEIKDRLGWLSSLEPMLARCDEIQSFAEEIKKANFNRAVLLGMGGSSLAPEVMRFVFGVRPGWPDLTVLDTTDPATINNLERTLDINKTLFLVSTKSGATIETLSLYKYFHQKLVGLKGEFAGENFVAITDPGSPLEKISRENKFRKLFLNPSDIGGRYSALSCFGLAPAALIGADIRAMLTSAINEYRDLAVGDGNGNYSGLELGVMLGEFYAQGVDKVTFLSHGVLESFGWWAEQLIAESTGKNNKGIVPVTGEPCSQVDNYGRDRMFVCFSASLSFPLPSPPPSPPRGEGVNNVFPRPLGEMGEGIKDVSPLPLGERVGVRGDGEGLESAVEALKSAGYPVAVIKLERPEDLGAEFFRWEVATVIAGSIMSINPFDEPNVQESKDNTKAVINYYQEKGELPSPAVSPLHPHPTLSLRERGRGEGGEGGGEGKVLANFLNQAKSGDYLAIMAYLEHNSIHHELLTKFRVKLRDKYKLATTLGYGPRFLHSTGQLHKGGANNGMFIQLTCDDPQDIGIPGEKYTFGVLKAAQALGDMTALLAKNRRAIRIHLGASVEKGLEKWLLMPQ